MAEKSFWGDKKDKKWFESFWYYYKKTVIWTVLVSAFVIFATVQCARKINYDCLVYYLGSGGVEDTTFSKVEEAFGPYVDDADGKAGVNVKCANLGFPADSDDIEAARAMAQKIQAELIAGEGYVYIMNNDLYVYTKNYEMLEDLSGITGDKEPVYAIDVTDSEYFKSLGFNTGEKLYVGLRKLDAKRENKEIYKIKHKNGVKVIQYIYGIEK